MDSQPSGDARYLALLRWVLFLNGAFLTFCLGFVVYAFPAVLAFLAWKARVRLRPEPEPGRAFLAT